MTLTAHSRPEFNCTCAPAHLGTAKLQNRHCAVSNIDPNFNANSTLQILLNNLINYFILI
jgi:hypothetical protein